MFSWQSKMGFKFRRYIHLIMTQILSVYCVPGGLLVSGDTAVTMIDQVSIFMEHSFQGGETNDNLVNRCKIRWDSEIKSDRETTLDPGSGKAFLSKAAFKPRSEY